MDVARAVPGVVIDLRYASSNNVLGRPLYPPSFRCLVRRTVAARLRVARDTLRGTGYQLVVLDAWRPASVQKELLTANNAEGYVASDETPPLHTWGLAVDVTLVDSKGMEVPMPTPFDCFDPAAWIPYKGSDPLVRRHLGILQKAMGKAGFHACPKEWWHFIVPDWDRYGPLHDPAN